MLTGIDHVNIVVNDLDKMAAFYCQALGMRETIHVTICGDWIDKVVGLHGVEAEVIYLELPSGPRIELIHYHTPCSASPAGLGEASTRGFRHLAFRVDDIDTIVTALSKAGVEFLSPVQKVPDTQVTFNGGVRKRLVYFRDPEDNLLELCEYRVSA